MGNCLTRPEDDANDNKLTTKLNGPLAYSEVKNPQTTSVSKNQEAAKLGQKEYHTLQDDKANLPTFENDTKLLDESKIDTQRESEVGSSQPPAPENSQAQSKTPDHIPSQNHPAPLDQPEFITFRKEVEVTREVQPQPKIEIESKPIEKPIEQPKIIEQPKPKEEPIPIEQPKPKEEPKPVEQPKPKEEPKPIEQPKPKEEPKPVEQPKPKEEPKPIEQPKPKEETKAKEVPKPKEDLKPSATKSDKTGVQFKVGTEMFVPLREGGIKTNYDILNLIGEGSQAKVVRVVHKDTGAYKAMKIIPKTTAVVSEEGKLFEEASLLRQADHPNILQLFELYQDDSSYYMISEYLSGGELFDKIKALENFSERQAADYMKQVFSAVSYLHESHIIHRDIKAENFLLASNEPTASLKLIDFGTAKKLAPGEKIQKLVGNYTYIAPETLKKNYDHRADVWACGVLLYILLGGNPPFKGNSNKEITAKIKAASFDFEGEEWQKISEDAKDLIRKLLVVDPDQRVSLKDAYNHVWIQKSATDHPIDSKALKNLSEFKSKSSLQHSILLFMTSQILSQKDKEELLKSFQKIDKDGNGTLSKEEILEGYKLVFGGAKSPEEILKIFEEVDANGSGEIDFNEFLVACYNKEKLLSQDMLHKAFQYYDSDNNGYISREELKEIMAASNLKDAEWNSIFAEIDKDNNGKITEKEFVKVMSTIGK